MVKRKSRKKATTKTEKVPESKPKPDPQPATSPTTPIQKKIVPKSRSESMQIFRASDFPEIGELVVGTCTKITPHGAYLEIGGYNKLGKSAGFVHISELSRTWVRNIRKFIREGQRTVARVMRINIERQEIDLSIRRVNDSQKRQTLQVAKQEQRAKGILKAIGERFKLNRDQIEEQIIQPLEATGSIYSTLEKARDEGVSVLLEAGLDEKLAEDLTQIAVKELERPSVTLSGKITVSTADTNGIITIQKAFTTAMKGISKNKDANISVLAVSAPDYKISLSAEDWKDAEKFWQSFQKSFSKTLKKEANNIIVLEFARE